MDMDMDFKGKPYKIINSDNLTYLKTLPDNCIDSVVTDPPYGLSFMNKQWDYDVPTTELWSEVLRVLKPGGHMLCFSGTRTQHRMACRIEDAGFEIRDILMWMHGQGFPKAADISKGIDKELGQYVKGELSPNSRNGVEGDENGYDHSKEITLDNPQSEEAKQWQGWKSALKPALEPITLARKPISENTIASNVLKHGTGGLNIDGCRISGDANIQGRFPSNVILEHHDECVQVGTLQISGTSTGNGNAAIGKGSKSIPLRRGSFTDRTDENGKETITEYNCHPECPIRMLNEQTGVHVSGARRSTHNVGAKSNNGKLVNNGIYSEYTARPYQQDCDIEHGYVSRFFYQAKASQIDRNEGCEELNIKKQVGHSINDKCKSCNEYALNCKCENKITEHRSIGGNNHPTIKSTALCKYLITLITPPGGICIDPFMGSGSTGKASMLIEGIRFIGIDIYSDYCDISRCRIEHAIANRQLILDRINGVKNRGGVVKKNKAVKDDGDLLF